MYSLCLLLTPETSPLMYLKYTSITMSVAKEFEVANATYVASFTKGDLQLPPQRCVDSARSILSLRQLSYVEGTTDSIHLVLAR